MCFQPPINLSCELLEIPAIFPVLLKNSGKPVKKKEIDYQLCFQKGQGQRKKLFLKLQLTVDLFKDSYRYGRNTPKLIFEHLKGLIFAPHPPNFENLYNF